MTTDAIWTQLSSDLRRFIRRRVSDDNVADDLLQETFMRVHRNLGSLQETDRLAAWVYRIARNVVNDHHRKYANLTVALADTDPMADGDDEPQSVCESATWLHEIIRSLPGGYREAVQMAEMEAISQQEVADRLKLSLSGAKSRIQRGRSMVKSVLEACCTFEKDGRGRVMGCEAKPNQTLCGDCGSSS